VPVAIVGDIGMHRVGLPRPASWEAGKDEEDPLIAVRDVGVGLVEHEVVVAADDSVFERQRLDTGVRETPSLESKVSHFLLPRPSARSEPTRRLEGNCVGDELIDLRFSKPVSPTFSSF